jgi:hypothetical protein
VPRREEASRETVAGTIGVDNLVCPFHWVCASDHHGAIVIVAATTAAITTTTASRYHVCSDYYRIRP